MKVGIKGTMSGQSSEAYYKGLNDKCREVMTAAFNSEIATQHAESHSFVRDLEVLEKCFRGGGPSSVFAASRREYEFALLAAAQGQYRQAFMALRLAFELALAAVRFSANEFEFRKWQHSGADIVWKVLIDADTGVLSKQFVRAFAEELLEQVDLYRDLAERLYRECSEYVHGNADTQVSLSDGLAFSKETFAAWHEKAEAFCQGVTFAVCVRYLSDTSKDLKLEMEPIVMDRLGHLPSIRATFGATVEKHHG